MVGVPLALLVVMLAPGPVDPYQQALAGPFDLRGLGGVLLAVDRLALAFTILAVVPAPRGQRYNLAGRVAGLGRPSGVRNGAGMGIGHAGR